MGSPSPSPSPGRSSSPAAASHGRTLVGSQPLPGPISLMSRSTVPAHQSHSPAVHSVSPFQHDAKPVVGDPAVAGGVATPTGRGALLLPASPSLPQHAVSTPPPPSAVPVQPTGSPVLRSSTSTSIGHPASSGGVPLEDPLDIFSRPSPAKSRPASRAPSPSSARLLSAASQPDLLAASNSSSSVLPLHATTPASPIPSLALSESALFERDVEHTTEHLLTGSEALDLASAPVLDEVAQAVSDDVPILPETLPLPLPLSASAGTPAQPGDRSPRSSIVPLGIAAPSGPAHPASIESALEQLSVSESQAASPSAFSGLPAGASTPDKPRALSFGSGARSRSTGGISPPPSLSLSPSISGSPSSSNPASPVTSMHPPASVPMQYPASAVYGKPSESMANEDSQPRRLSFISYADIINSERLPAQLAAPDSSSALSFSGSSSPSSGGLALQPLSPGSNLHSSSPFSPVQGPSRPHRGFPPGRTDSAETVTKARHEEAQANTWGVVELGKSLAGSAAGLLSSVGLSGSGEDGGLQGLATGGPSQIHEDERQERS